MLPIKASGANGSHKAIRDKLGSTMVRNGSLGHNLSASVCSQLFHMFLHTQHTTHSTEHTSHTAVGTFKLYVPTTIKIRPVPEHMTNLSFQHKVTTVTLKT